VAEAASGSGGAAEDGEKEELKKLAAELSSHPSPEIREWLARAVGIAAGSW